MLLPDRAAAAAAAAVHRVVGLRALIYDDARGWGSNVVTRKIAASRRAVCCCHGGGDPGSTEEEEREEEEDLGEEGGFWVLYGWRRRLRRLPPLIPSIRRAGSSPWALSRTRTTDGRIVVEREPAPLRGRVMATKLDGRLVIDLVEHDDGPVRPPPPRRCSKQHQIAYAADDEEKEATAHIGSARRDVPTTAARVSPPMTTPVGSGSPLPAVGCFEAVIRTSPLHKVPVNLLRMVH